MYEKESLVPKEGAVIRECIIPTESIRMINIALNDDENGTQYAFNSSGTYLNDNINIMLLNNLADGTKLVPIILRKRLLYQDLEAS